MPTKARKMPHNASNTFTLYTLPPKLNDTYKIGKGRFYKAREAKETQEALSWEIKATYKGPFIPENDVFAVVSFYYPNKRPDLDAGEKSLFDAMQGIVYKNDRQVQSKFVAKYVDKEKPRVEIQIMEL